MVVWPLANLESVTVCWLSSNLCDNTSSQEVCSTLNQAQGQGTHSSCGVAKGSCLSIS